MSPAEAALVYLGPDPTPTSLLPHRHVLPHPVAAQRSCLASQAVVQVNASLLLALSVRHPGVERADAFEVHGEV